MTEWEDREVQPHAPAELAHVEDPWPELPPWPAEGDADDPDEWRIAQAEQIRRRRVDLEQMGEIWNG